jgi:hypothetical protein
VTVKNLKHDYGRGGKQVDCVYSDDNTPTWQDKLKNQMGFAAASHAADQVRGKTNRGHEDQRQLLEDLGVKSYTENDQAEAAQDRLVPEKNEPKSR